MRGFVLAVVFASLLGGALFGPLVTKAGSRAYASEPAFVLYGYVQAGDGVLPSKVRASIGDATCGTADVSATSASAGAYALVVVPADQKTGCGTDGALVQVQLIRGEIGPGVLAAQVPWRAGGLVRFDLSMASTASVGGFVGVLPDGPGTAALRWSGASGVPVERAVATIARTVESVNFWDVRRQSFRTWVPGAPVVAQGYTLVDADDIVFVRVK
jgi:hypothetical protein